MAKGTNLAVWLDLQNHPLGSGRGENFHVPMNYVLPPARIYVVNHSRVQKRKEVAVPVSAVRGAEEALIFDKELARIYNVDTLVKRIEQGKDMNRYAMVTKPVIFTFRCGGQVYAIPPARDADSPPPRVEVREGAWDLFLGNYQRMRSDDPTMVGDEKSRLAVMWRLRHNPVLRYTDDGDTTALDNPFGYIEFIRETQKQMTDPLDKEYLAALDLVEV